WTYYDGISYSSWSGNTLTPPYTAIGTYTFTVTEDAGGCASIPNTVSVTILPSDWPELAGNNLNVDEQGEDVQVDANGNFYVTGACGISAEFGQGSNQATINGDGFVAKYDVCGILLWVRELKKVGKSLVLDNNQENVIITGGGTDNAFLCSYSQNGVQNWYENIYTGSQGSEVSGTSIDMDQNNQIYFTGYYTRSIHFGGLSGAPFLVALNLAQHGFVAMYDINGLHLSAVNLEMATSTGTIIPRGIAVTDTPAPMQVYVGGSYSGNATFSGQTLNGNGEFIVGLASPSLNGLVASNVVNILGASIAPLSELDWHDTGDKLLVTGGSMVAGLSPMLVYDWSFVSANSTFVDLDYVEQSGALYLSGQDNTTQAALVAKVKPAAGFNWISTAMNPAGPDIAKGVASNGIAFGGNKRKVFTTGGFVDKISFPSVFLSFIANGTTSDIFVAKVVDHNNYGTFRRKDPTNMPVSIDDNDMEITIYPNPFTENFWVDLSQIDESEFVNIEVLDIAGKRIMKKDKVLGGGKQELELSHINDGIYLILVIQKDKRYIQKLIKQ
ncbi:MAG: T9SS type A sorting domain-containing protein, partial [Flavobacteriales bacterium]|nr:T9SS type A sorting domain-containing protein [Flavobacteriales bacterium]